MSGKQLMGSMGAISTRFTKADYKRLYEDERARRITQEHKRVAELVAALKEFGCHTPDCKSYKVIGRFGSRSGLRWAERHDAETCTCGLGKGIRGGAWP